MLGRWDDGLVAGRQLAEWYPWTTFVRSRMDAVMARCHIELGAVDKGQQLIDAAADDLRQVRWFFDEALVLRDAIAALRVCGEEQAPAGAIERLQGRLDRVLTEDLVASAAELAPLFPSQ